MASSGTSTEPGSSSGAAWRRCLPDQYQSVVDYVDATTALHNALQDPRRSSSSLSVMGSSSSLNPPPVWATLIRHRYAAQTKLRQVLQQWENLVVVMANDEEEKAADNLLQARRKLGLQEQHRQRIYRILRHIQQHQPRFSAIGIPLPPTSLLLLLPNTNTPDGNDHDDDDEEGEDDAHPPILVSLAVLNASIQQLLSHMGDSSLQEEEDH